MQVQLTGKQLIEGHWVSAGKGSFHAINPDTGETLTPAFAHDADPEADDAMLAAQCAFTVTRELSVERRVQLLEAIAGQIMALGDELLQRAHLETGLPLAGLPPHPVSK